MGHQGRGRVIKVGGGVIRVGVGQGRGRVIKAGGGVIRVGVGQGRGRVIKAGGGVIKVGGGPSRQVQTGGGSLWRGGAHTTGGPYSTQHSLEDTQDSDVVWIGPWMVH